MKINNGVNWTFGGPNSPCYGCEFADRPQCRSKCEPFKEYQEERERFREHNKTVKEAENIIMEISKKKHKRGQP